MTTTMPMMPHYVVKPTVQRILRLTDRVSDYFDTEVLHPGVLVAAVVNDLKKGTYVEKQARAMVEDLAKIEQLQSWLENALEGWRHKLGDIIYVDENTDRALSFKIQQIADCATETAKRASKKAKRKRKAKSERKRRSRK